MKCKFLWVCLFVVWGNFVFSQQAKYAVRTVAFYNVENLFDTIDDTNVNDTDRTPEGDTRWTQELYQDHLNKIASVIEQIGSDVRRNAPDIVGLAEVENRGVIEDLLKTSYLQNKNYGIAHFESPDKRGIDVALLYNKDVFKIKDTSKHELLLYETDGKKRIYTRDQLLVSGYLDGELVYFIVNHWPSRRGGEARSRRLRESAAALNKQIIDSVLKVNPEAKIISMGDFNDDAVNSSFKKILKTKSKKSRVKKGELYNPMEDMYRRGMGTLAYRDSWSLFDQIYFTQPLLEKDKSSYRFWKAGIFNKAFLANPRGRYKGYPHRSVVGTNYTGGYSDHFPVYIYLIKKLSE
ncbi:MAG: endonuclease/exonuclease/phosphatase family protein [Flavobacteriaceae bacterium]|nr:endonuclease/exonuclease/phosphatase family protein [Flavobacteriaceae bacterium]